MLPLHPGYILLRHLQLVPGVTNLLSHYRKHLRIPFGTMMMLDKDKKMDLRHRSLRQGRSGGGPPRCRRDFPVTGPTNPWT